MSGTYIRTAALLAAFVLLVLPVSSCGGSAGPQAAETAAADNAADTAGGAAIDPDPAEPEETGPDYETGIRNKYRDSDYGGTEVVILSMKEGTFWYNLISPAANEVWYAEQSGDIYEDAVYRRNMMTEELLNVKIKPLFLADGMTNFESIVKKSVKAGDASFDMALGPLSYQISLASDGYLTNLRGIKELDLGQPWFDQAIIGNYAYKGEKLYAVTGAANVFDDYAVPIVFYGRDIVDRYGIGDPADLVPDGKWTIEAMMSMAESVSADLDGDGAITDADSFGYLDNTGVMVHMMEAAGNTITSVDENGVPYLNCFSRGYVEAGEFIFDRVINSGAVRFGDNAADTEIFKDRRGLFYYQILGVINQLRDMETSFSLLPNPKYDESQENYVNSVNSVWCTTFSVPVTNEKTAVTGDTLNVMSAFSVNTVNSVLYELLLGSKLIREEKTLDMLGYTLNSKKYCWGNGYSWSGPITEILNAQVTAKTFTMASSIEKSSSKIQKAFDKLIQKFDALEG